MFGDVKMYFVACGLCLFRKFLIQFATENNINLLCVCVIVVATAMCVSNDSFPF